MSSGTAYERYDCGCFLKVYVCPEHLKVAGEKMRKIEVARKLQYELREGREAEGEADLPF